VDMWSKFFII